MTTDSTLLFWDSTALDVSGCFRKIVSNRPCIALQAASGNQYIYAEGILPSHYGSGNMKLNFLGALETSTSGTFQINTQYERITSNTFLVLMNTDDFGGSSTISSGVVFESGAALTARYFTGPSPTNTNFRNANAGDLFRIRISRDNSVTYNVSGDILIFGVSLDEVIG